MPEQPETPAFEFDLQDRGGQLRFTTPQELRQWNNKELEKWQWVGNQRSMAQVLQTHRQLQNQIEQYVQEWQNAIASKRTDRVEAVFKSIGATLKQYYPNERILNSRSTKGGFTFKLKEQRGEAVAAGAYAALLGSELSFSQPVGAEFFQGIVEGFLYEREIDWTATAHQEALDTLRQQYAENLSQQQTRLKEIEERNRALNEQFETVLSGRETKLGQLHDDQVTEFKKLVDKHVENLKTIEDTYNQKLALQKPVDYWQAKEKYHGALSKRFGWIALAVSLVLLAAMGCLVHWTFGQLQPDQDPKHWQYGLLVVAAFFSIWAIRVLLRLFFSNLHLATDAAERRTMILTFLSMSREGAEFAPEDKTLIVQHLFRSAADGLVKDDATPPGIFEWLTRR